MKAAIISKELADADMLDSFKNRNRAIHMARIDNQVYLNQERSRLSNDLAVWNHRGIVSQRSS